MNLLTPWTVAAVASTWWTTILRMYENTYTHSHIHTYIGTIVIYNNNHKLRLHDNFEAKFMSWLARLSIRFSPTIRTGVETSSLRQLHRFSADDLQDILTHTHTLLIYICICIQYNLDLLIIYKIKRYICAQSLLWTNYLEHRHRHLTFIENMVWAIKYRPWNCVLILVPMDAKQNLWQ